MLAVSALALIMCLGGAPAAMGQTPAAPTTNSAVSDEIIVTASKRSSTVQDTPFSINALSQLELERSGIGSIEELSRNVAGLVVQNLGPGQSQVSIRGVSAGQVVRDQPGVKEQVGIYIDESVISLSLFTPDLDFFDLNRVETLRGPQGTLFGSGSIGGTLRYITNQPKLDVVEGEVELNVNGITDGGVGGGAKGAINIPLIRDKLAVRAVGYYTRYGGYIDALREGGRVDENVNSGSRYGGRLAFTLKPTEWLTITPRVIYQKQQYNGFNRQEVFNLFANPFTTTRTPITFEEREQFLLLREGFDDETIIADAVFNANFGPVEATAVSSYTNRDILVSRDASALTGSVSVDLGFPAAGVLLPSNLLDATRLYQFTQELRFASTGSGPFQWVFGAFYSTVDRNYQQTLPTPGYDAFTDAVLGAGTSRAVANGFGVDSPFNSQLPYDIRQLAGFGEASYEIIPKLKFTAGGRYYNFREDRTITSGGLFANGDTGRRDTTRSSGFTPRFLLSYELAEDFTVNAQASRGFRLGGVNDPLNVPLCQGTDLATFGGFQTYDDETLWNYEVGFKARRPGLTFNSAAFYTDISDLQVTLDAGSCSSRISFNVPKAHTVGVEWEIKAQPWRGLDLGLSGSLVQSEFDSTVRGGPNNDVLGGIQNGNRLASVPNFQLSANVAYNFTIAKQIEAYVSASLQHVGTRYTQPSDQVDNPRAFVSNLPFGGASGNNATVLDLELDSYQLVNLSAGLDFPNRVSVIFYINNLIDENAQLAFDRERGGRARLAFSTNQPRTFGVTTRYKF